MSSLSASALYNLLRLHRSLAAEPLALAAILRLFGDADTFYAEVTPDWLREANLPPAVAAALSVTPDRTLQARLEADLRWLEQPDHHLLTLWDPAYPSRLAHIADPPPLLFIRGDASAPGTEQIAMVGSRKMSAVGRRAAIRLATDLARAGLTITSGLAIGIDGAAHRAAIDAGAATVAVLACGADLVYPPRHTRLAEAVADCGAIVSELPLGEAPMPYQFPRRNRIVTGLSLGTIVVEAAIASGSLVSARLAAEQGREVFAVPGSIFGGQSEGCHQLIKSGARLIDCADDVLCDLPGFDCGESTLARPTLEGIAAAIVDALETEPSTADELSLRLSLPVTDLLPLLADLEIDGVISGSADGYMIRG